MVADVVVLRDVLIVAVLAHRLPLYQSTSWFQANQAYQVLDVLVEFIHILHTLVQRTWVEEISWIDVL